MNEAELKQILNTEHVKIEPTGLGISNTNFLVTANGRRYMLRVPGAGNERNRHHEAWAMKRAEKLDVPVCYFDELSGIKLTQFVEGLDDLASSNDPDKYRLAGQMVGALHELEVPPFRFDPFALLEVHKEQSGMELDFPYEKEVIDHLSSIYKWESFCHNDLVPGNLLFGNGRGYVIDYEYAAANDARFDVASFFSENQILDPVRRAQFYEGLGLQYDEKEIFAFELFLDILWAYWALALYRQRNDLELASIVQEKLVHYRQVLKILAPETNF